MNPSKIDLAIFCATRDEAMALRHLQRGPVEPLRFAGRRATLARFGPHSSIVIAVGLREKTLTKSYEALISSHRPRLAVNFGAAGAIDPELEIGTPTLPLEIIAYKAPNLQQIGESIETEDWITETGDRKVLAREETRSALSSPQFHPLDPAIRLTRAGTCPQNILEEDLRARLREKLQIDTTDWESYTLGVLSKVEGIPFFALRCITDHADEAAKSSYKRSAKEVLEQGAQTLLDLLERIPLEFPA